MKNKRIGIFGVFLLLAFAFWTLLVKTIDVQSIGPQGSMVGFASMNLLVHQLTGIHLKLYILTDWLSLVPVGFMMAFAILGLFQWIRRKCLLKVDFSILALGVFYFAVMMVYCFFETVIINYRPIMPEGIMEASYPSSTTMLVLCVIPTAIMQLLERIRNSTLKLCSTVALGCFAGFMLLCRFISGVHWFSDIIGGILFSAGAVLLYYSVTCKE